MSDPTKLSVSDYRKVLAASRTIGHALKMCEAPEPMKELFGRIALWLEDHA